MNEQLNILFIQADQFRHDCLGSRGHPVVRTPNLDALAGEGMLFESAYTPSCPCAPARASLFTGRFADSHGLVCGMDELDPPDVRVLPQYLQDAGYETALVGKLHLRPFRRDYGFEYNLRNDMIYTNYGEEEARESAYIQYLRDSVDSRDPDELLRRFTADEASFETDEQRFMLGSNVVDEEHHHTTWTANETMRFLRREHERPFFLSCSFYGPHQPYLCPGRWGGLYAADDVPLPEDFDVGTEDKPLLQNSFLAGPLKRRRAAGWDQADYRRVLAAYYGGISMIDHYVGRIVDELQALGLWDRTIVVFTSDHGDYAGQFRSFYKSLGYEGSAHVPLIVHDPRSVQQGRREACHVSTLDLFSYFAAAAAAAVPEDVESKDLSPLVVDGKAPRENQVFFKQADFSMIVRDGLKLCRGAAGEGTAYEFYDLAERPVEAVNRINDPRHASSIVALRARLDAWHEDQEERGRRRR